MPPVLGIVSPEEWLQRTKLAFRGRSSMVAVDKAYANYYNLRTPANEDALYQALHKYLNGKGGNWDNVERNKNSGGLMAHIYKSCKPLTPANVLEKRVPESRHGVLYLWQKASVETQWLKVSLQGGLGLGSQIAEFAELDDLAEALTYGESKAKDIVKNKVPTNPMMIVGPSTSCIRLAELPEDPSVLERVRRWLGAKFHYVYDLILTSVRKLWNDLHLVGELGWSAAKVTNLVLREFAKGAAPLAGSAIEVVQGLAKAFSASLDRVSAWRRRSNFLVAPGHPFMIARAIETQMDWDIGNGLYDLAKGGLKLAGELTTFGASSLINLVAACVEFVHKICNRLNESRKMNLWLAHVKAATANRNKWKADPVGGVWRPAVVFNDREFRHLFEEGCDASVCIPMMTLNSGIAGDLMMFMKIFDDSGSILGQSTGETLDGPSGSAQKKFDAGQTHFAQLKEKGRDYLESSGFRFRSADKVANGLMIHAIRDHRSIPSMSDRALAFVAGG